MDVVAVIQARIGSTRLPGKMMYPLDGEPVLSHVIRRVRCAETLTDVVVATSTEERDGVLASEAARQETSVFRGSESDVLGRMYNAAVEADADIVVRICADNPLLSPEYIDILVERVMEGDVDYVSNNLVRTIPIGLDLEAFTMDSFSRVESSANSPEEREHVTLRYKNSSGRFTIKNIPAQEVFAEKNLLDRTDLRLTLDTLPDYKLQRTVYDNVSRGSEGIISLSDAIAYIDENQLTKLNYHVSQKEVGDSDE